MLCHVDWEMVTEVSRGCSASYTTFWWQPRSSEMQLVTTR